MGIDVRVESESGEVIAEIGDAHGWTKALLPHLTDSESYCLRFVDRCGDAVFNQFQIPFLITEVRRRLDQIREPAKREHAEEILRLIESAQGKSHTYVRFLGD